MSIRRLTLFYNSYKIKSALIGEPGKIRRRKTKAPKLRSVTNGGCRRFLFKESEVFMNDELVKTIRRSEEPETAFIEALCFLNQQLSYPEASAACPLVLDAIL